MSRLSRLAIVRELLFFILRKRGTWLVTRELRTWCLIFRRRRRREDRGGVNNVSGNDGVHRTNVIHQVGECEIRGSQLGID
jgi:hypothetical protein